VPNLPHINLKFSQKSRDGGMDVIKEKFKEENNGFRKSRDELRKEMRRRETLKKVGIQQVGLGANASASPYNNVDISNARKFTDFGSHENTDVMNREFSKGISVRDAIAHIQTCVEEREKSKNQEVAIVVPGFSFPGCDYQKVLEDEKVRDKPKKSTPMQILI